MKIKVLKSFYDRECDLKLREPKDELDVSEPRAKDLISKGFAEEIKPAKKEKKTESEKKSAARQGKAVFGCFYRQVGLRVICLCGQSPSDP